MITDNQKINLRRLSNEDKLEIFEFLKEELGLINTNEYIEATGQKRSSVYLDLKNDKIKSVVISGNKYPIINY